MKRIDADGHDGNLFTDGNPSTGVEATILDASWANSAQTELINLVEEAGLVPDQTNANLTQVLTAIKYLIEAGGTINDKMALADGQAGPANVTVIPAFDKTKVKSARMLVDVFRRNNSKSANEQFELAPIYDPEGDSWSLHFTSFKDDATTVFTITAGGQIQYTTDAYAGVAYAGTLRVSHVKTIAI